MGALSLSSRAIIGEFYNHLEQSPLSWVEAIGMRFESNQPSETYAWLGQAPAMREWIGGRNAKGFRENGITITNKLFEATIEVTLDEIKYDKTGQVMTRVRETAQRTNAHWGSLLSTLLLNGASTICYDGQYFYDTDHSEGSSGTQSNSITSPATTPTAPTVQEMADAIMAGVQQFYALKDDQGEPINETAQEFILMVPVPLWKQALAAVRNAVLASGVTNTIPNVPEFKITPVVNPRLTWTTKFALFRTDAETKPFILQEEEPVNVSAVAEGSELEFKERKHNYGVDAKRNVGYGYWQYSVLVTLT